MQRKLLIPGWRILVLTATVALLSLLALSACGGEEAPPPSPTTIPPATAMPAPTEAPPPTSTPAATPTPEPTAAPDPTATPEPTSTPMPTAAPPATVAPQAPQTPVATVAPATPEPTAAPTATEAPPTPEPSATPRSTAAPATPLAPCAGTRGGQVGNCAPELAGTQEWINSEPLAMQELRGKVVLIDFWTYSCINCIRTLPFLQTWHERYADEGLVILGVHTPEFEFEKVYENVVQATKDMGVAWPVVQDNDYRVWRSYSNRFWPAKYLIDKNGVIQYRHFGEGRYAETEQEIRKLLAEVGAASEALTMPLPEDQRADQAFRNSDTRRTPELFAGWRFTSVEGRGGIGQVDTYMEAARASYQAGDQQGVVTEFEGPENIRPNLIYFHGPWSIGPESVVHARETEEFIDAVILLYSARSVNAVLTSESGDPYKVVVTVNNEYLTEENKGEDIVIGENGESYLMVTSPRAYKIVEHTEWEELQILAMSSTSDDFGLFSFTFGTYEDGF